MKEKDRLILLNGRRHSLSPATQRLINPCQGNAHQVLIDYIEKNLFIPASVRVDIEILYLEQFVSNDLGSIRGVLRVNPTAIFPDNEQAARETSGYYEAFISKENRHGDKESFAYISKLSRMFPESEVVLRSVDFTEVDVEYSEKPYFCGGKELFMLVRKTLSISGVTTPLVLKNPDSASGSHYFETKEHAESFVPRVSVGQGIEFKVMSESEWSTYVTEYDPMSRSSAYFE